MSRKQLRERLMQMLFQMDIQKDYSETARNAYVAVYMPESGQTEYFDTLYALIRDNLESIDAAIEECSDNWSVGRMAKVDLSILRLAAGEIIYIDGIPDSASANEAVNLAKKFGGDDSRKFVNGILGRLIQRKTAVTPEAGRRPDDAGL
ncbi:MAG: transcription antitermination factor NusB [Clostridiales Family XIII bacterium]|nr:transcription antitermination factor NusB [Clostridiales Family XIII bacterium]